MLAIMLSELLFERQAFHAVLLAVSRPSLNEIDYFAFNGLLNISIGLLMIGRRYYGVMRHRLMEIVIQRLGLLVELVKNGTLLALLSAINDVKGGCFGAAFMAIQRGLGCFGRKIGALLKRQLIKPRLSQLLTVGYDSKVAKESL
jgi:hypothetical protein